MTVSYDITTNVGKIRLMIGDKDIANYIFTDEELTHFYSSAGSLNLAAAEALEAWAAQYGANADTERIGDYSYAQNIVTKMLAMAKQYREKEATTPAMDWGGFNFTDEEETE